MNYAIILLMMLMTISFFVTLFVWIKLFMQGDKKYKIQKANSLFSFHRVQGKKERWFIIGRVASILMIISELLFIFLLLISKK